IPTGMLFDPTSGIIYDSSTSENTKLMRLGNEGRSTATTMTAISILKALQNQNQEKKKQKILSFTDNRQDASLQSGHFNDFIGVVRLRSAIFHALNNAAQNTLTIESIASKVKNQLNLRESEFARIPNDEIPNTTNQQAIEKFLFYKILVDLKRGWRYILPNLELCGLLKIEFKEFDSFVYDESIWKGDILLGKVNPQKRYNILYQILNYFRQSFAIDHRFFDNEELDKNEKLIEDNLDRDKIWSLNREEKINRPNALFLRQIPDARRRSVYFVSAGTRSKLGKYIKRMLEEHVHIKLSGDELEQYIEELFKQLKKHSYLVETHVKYDDQIFNGYKINSQVLQWTKGDGQTVIRDDVNHHYFREVELEPNKFFQKFYQQDFSSYQASLIAREHTGQIDKEQRIERENDFREGDIAALFCSPTMELGIDISELNVVHLRNVPPNPANYVQRSGRAGRSGQTALIFNYCALGSPHDRHYYSHSIDMVAGVVVPPRIDLANKDLLQAHINAYLFMEMKLDSVKEAVEDLIQIGNNPESSFPIKDDISNVINDLITRKEKEYFENIKKILQTNFENSSDSNWYNDEWILQCIRQFHDNLDKAFNRWRLLFRNALIERNNAQNILNDFTIREDHRDKTEASKNYFNSKKQILLLRYQKNKEGTRDSEFYIFRYLASEGFFPGYNFVRLPIRSFLGKRNEGGVFISRPRFIALREFGPGNIIYHNGNKYRIKKLMLPSNQFDANTRKLKVCRESGYAFFDSDGDGINNDPITSKPLDGGDRVKIYKDMIEVTETTAVPQERISSQEEERMRMGYKVDLYFNFPDGIKGAEKSVISNHDDELLNLWFYKAANLIEVNHQWKSSNRDGFFINKKNGVFEQQRNLNEDEEDNITTTRLFTTDTADMALIQPIDVLNLEENGVVTLAFALKRAIERLYQIEESEIGVQIIGDSDASNILIYEASEGSLGILSQISQDRDKLNEVFKEAYKVCHFDPETHRDIRPDIGPASYNDVLSYYNQIYHEQLDRFSIQEALRLLISCQTNNTEHFNSRKENLEYLYDNYDRMSKLEKQFIDALEKYEGRLPNKAQVNLSSIANTYASADFFYSDDKVLVFIDGNVHDREDVADADNAKRQALKNAGFTVIVWNYKEPIEDFLERNKHIFNCKKLNNESNNA
ncbi:MAG: helicase-related protein, partial [bacterium]